MCKDCFPWVSSSSQTGARQFLESRMGHLFLTSSPGTGQVMVGPPETGRRADRGCLGLIREAALGTDPHTEPKQGTVSRVSSPAACQPLHAHSSFLQPRRLTGPPCPQLEGRHHAVSEEGLLGPCGRGHERWALSPEERDRSCRTPPADARKWTIYISFSSSICNLSSLLCHCVS